MLRLSLFLAALLVAAAAAQPAPPMEFDSRLDKVVTLYHPQADIAEVLDGIEKSTGAPLRALAGVAEEPVSVLVTEQPAGEVLRQLAGLLDCRWMKTGNQGAPRYGLIATQERLRVEREKLKSELREALPQLYERVKQDLAAPNLVPADRALLRLAVSLTPR